MADFVNRETELKYLEKEYKSKKAEFVPIYGRRRIGKSRLIEEFIKNKKNTTYYLASKQDLKLQINEFKESLTEIIKSEYLQKQEFNNWSELFSFLKEIWPKDKKIILAIDEITYIIAQDKGFTSQLNKFWEECLEKSQTFLIVSGSVYGLMLKEVLGHSSPLYGRRSGQIHLQEFSFKETLKFTKNYSFDESIMLYGLLGGVAKYLLLALKTKKFKNFLQEQMLDPNSFFYEEATHYLELEFKEPNTFVSIIKAIAQGYSKVQEIAQYVGIENSKVSSYLNILINLRLIEKIIPITQRDNKNKLFRGAKYKVADRFLEFWYKIMSKYRSRLIIDFDRVIVDILRDITQYTGFVYEDIVKEFLENNNPDYDWGREWGKCVIDGEKGTYEIDLMGLSLKKEKVIFVEVKWKDNVNAEKILGKLKEKTQYVNWRKDKRVEEYILVARSFKVKSDNAICLELKDLKKYFQA